MFIDALSTSTPKAPPPTPVDIGSARVSHDTAPAVVPDDAHAKASPSLATVQAAARQLEQFLQSIGRTIEFRVDAATHMTVVTVKDSSTGDVIRQIPSDETLRLAEHLDATKTSALLNLKA